MAKAGYIIVDADTGNILKGAVDYQFAAGTVANLNTRGRNVELYKASAKLLDAVFFARKAGRPLDELEYRIKGDRAVL